MFMWSAGLLLMWAMQWGPVRAPQERWLCLARRQSLVGDWPKQALPAPAGRYLECPRLAKGSYGGVAEVRMLLRPEHPAASSRDAR